MNKKIIFGVVIILIICLVAKFLSVEKRELVYNVERQSVTEINGQLINTSAKYITFANFNTSFIANNDLLETQVAPVFHYFNDKVYLPMELVLTELGYVVESKGRNYNIDNASTNESYTINISNDSLKDNNQDTNDQVSVSTTKFNDILYIDLKDLSKNFDVYYNSIDGVYGLSTDSNEFFHEKIINQYKLAAIPEYKAMETEENFNKYIEVNKEINDVYEVSFFEETIYYILSKFEHYSEDTLTSTESNIDYSDTITQYDDVGEGDIVKTDGEYIYYARDYQYYIDSIEIISTNENGELSNTATIELENVTIKDLYLENDVLVVVGDYYVEKKQDPINRRLDLANKVVTDQSFIMQFDISDKENPVLIRENYFTGKYFDSRVIEGRVYVFSKARMFDYYSYNNLPMYKNSLDGEFKNVPYENIYYNLDLDGRHMLNIFSCKIGDINEELLGYSYIMKNGVQINVNSDNMYLAMYMDNQLEPATLYMNTNYIKDLNKSLEQLFKFNTSYSSYPKSKIVKFNFEDGVITYVDTGYIDGIIQDQYSFDEYQSYLRVAVTNVGEEVTYFEENDVDASYETVRSNKLFVLDENMNVVGESKAFGNEEEIKSVRFMGDKAYVVTFRTIDPLFVFDLEDPAKPTVLGELKIPGFSTFMLPFEENYLIGFGVDTEETENGGFISKGLKLSLFDVTDYLNPIEKFNVNLGEFQSYALSDPKAIMFNPSRKIITDEYINYNDENSFNGATIYSIDSEKGFIHLGDVEHIKKEVDENLEYEENEKSNSDIGSSSTAMYYIDESGFVKRIIQIENNIYTVSDTKVQSNSLSSFEMLSELYFKNK